MAYKRLSPKDLAEVLNLPEKPPTRHNLKPKPYLRDQYISFLVPAAALVHPDNPEQVTKIQKIQLAVLRYHQNGDFNSTLKKVRPAFHVFLEKINFNPEKMGYDVVGWIKV